MRVAELCAGYGGLFMSLVAAGWDVDLAWYAENDPDASAVMARHHPGVANLGDIRRIDWAAAEPVDVLTGGYPCQPFSSAGLRKGWADERAIWSYIADAVRVVRPRLLLCENVRGHLARGLSRVVAELAGIGYVGSWICVRASDLGAPHRRDRVFFAAHPAGADPATVWPILTGASGGGAVGDGGLDLLPTPSTRDAERGSGYTHEECQPLSETVMRLVPLLPTPTVMDGLAGPGQGVNAQGSPNLRTAAALFPTPRASDSDSDKGGPNQRGNSGDLMLPSAVMQLPKAAITEPSDGGLFDVQYSYRWGQYGAAVARWEQITGRPAPDPTEPGRKGIPRLAARFVEWMMGLPDGHVTDVCARKGALKVLGGGIVPAQGAIAYTVLRRILGAGS